ncbi:MAG: aminoacetone oxidase family FAD-binding enzyme [Rhodobacterales bacterium]|nr:MAG: aminoacetone oxidase family FAD-binding enzyme [Rhodobacterales bacterium]
MDVQTLILGAGAAGMMAAAHAGPSTLVIDHARRAGEKIRISGGGRCNFTNIYADAENFICPNRHFVKSALAQYGPWDFVELVDRYGIAWHEKTLGQLFCDGKSTQIVEMLRSEMAREGAELWLNCDVVEVTRQDRFRVVLKREGKQHEVFAHNLVIATGGKSIPKMGATGIAYDIAAKFGHRVHETRPGLVPFTFPEGRFAPLTGVAIPVRASVEGCGFNEALLFTHRGLSGPAVLQISSYWREGQTVRFDLLPGQDIFALLRDLRQREGRKGMANTLAALFPARLAAHLADTLNLSGKLADHSDTALRNLAEQLHQWEVRPSGTEGYRTAEVTLGGVDTDGISSKTLMSKTVPNLYFIGECVDVTGWLGGYNFQWAWSSAMAAARSIKARQGM